MSEPATKAQLEGVQASLRQDIRDVLDYLKESQAVQDKHLEEIDSKLDAIMEMLATRKELHNLIRALKKQGIKIDESEILTG
ncbi:MAG: hypothetical protein Q8Q20_02855 [bacterium]|nr:hypothetical protein [bacterium]